MVNLDLRSNLKTILSKMGKSQLELAKAINISPTNLNTRLARGRNCQLSLLEDICKELDVDLNQLVSGTQADGLQERSIHTSAIEETNVTYQEKYIATLEDNQRLYQELAKAKEKLHTLEKLPPQSRKRGNGE
jgi:DNA-binding Xre family transcriptional regulator